MYAIRSYYDGAPGFKARITHIGEKPRGKHLHEGFKTVKALLAPGKDEGEPEVGALGHRAAPYAAKNVPALGQNHEHVPPVVSGEFLT